MTPPFDAIRNHHEQAVFRAVKTGAAKFQHFRDEDLLADVACVALNRITPRYIRHSVDFSFYLSDEERADNERAIADAVAFAFEFVNARIATHAGG